MGLTVIDSRRGKLKQIACCQSISRSFLSNLGFAVFGTLVSLVSDAPSTWEPWKICFLKLAVTLASWSTSAYWFCFYISRFEKTDGACSVSQVVLMSWLEFVSPSSQKVQFTHRLQLLLQYALVDLFCGTTVIYAWDAKSYQLASEDFANDMPVSAAKLIM